MVSRKCPALFDVLVLFSSTVWEQNINNSSEIFKKLLFFATPEKASSSIKLT